VGNRVDMLSHLVNRSTESSCEFCWVLCRSLFGIRLVSIWNPSCGTFGPSLPQHVPLS
jgi:hypothetical protein